MPFNTMDIESGVNEDLALSIDLSDTVGAIDITGATFDMVFTGPTGIVLELSTANGGITTPNPTAGTFSLYAPASTMASIPPGLYAYALTFAQAGQTFELASGRLLLI